MKNPHTNAGVYLALALSAASGMIYQVVSMNYLFFYFTQNTYSIATVLSVFLLGLGAGSYLVHKFSKTSTKFFIVVQAFTGIYGIFILSNLEKIIPHIDPFGIIVVSTLILLPPTICLGATFPLATRMAKAESEIGLIYAVDLLGAVFGTVLAGFLLIPFFGNAIAAFGAAMLNFLAILFVNKEKQAIYFAIPIVGIILILILAIENPRPSSTYEPVIINDITFYPGSGVRFSQYSPYGKVVVQDDALRIDTREQCRLFWGNEELSMVGMALDPLNRSDLTVANIGLGCGGTATEILKHVDGNIDVIEINPAVIRANNILSNIQEHPRINIILDDGVEYLRKSTKQYDAILIDIEEPAIIHASNMYTAESFAIVASRLGDRGVLAIWACPCQNKEYSDILYNTLRKSFPYVYKPGNVTFVASKSPLPYAEYTGEHTGINTLDHKILSKVYFEKCSEWFNTDYQRDLVLAEVRQ